MSDLDPDLERAIGRAWRSMPEPDPARLAAIMARVERAPAPPARRVRPPRWVVVPLLLGAAAAAALAGYGWWVREPEPPAPAVVPAPGAAPAPARESTARGGEGVTAPATRGRGTVIYRQE